MVPVPDRLKKFPLWKGVFPIHYTVWTNDKGEPDFKVMHERKREECFDGNLCHLCGESLGGTEEVMLVPVRRYRQGRVVKEMVATHAKRFAGGVYAFIGGPKCIDLHVFVDGPMHVECAEYAARVCPYLSATLYKAVVPVMTIKGVGPNPFEDATVASDGVKVNTRPAKMALVVSDSYAVRRNKIRHEFPGGSHADDPTAGGQLTAVAGTYIHIDWSIMPERTEPVPG